VKRRKCWRIEWYWRVEWHPLTSWELRILLLACSVIGAWASALALLR
jgi:hypothetical protein